MQEEYGMAGVRFWMTWLALVIAALIVRPHRIGMAIVGLVTLVWAAFVIRFVIRKVKAGADLLDIDLMLCVVALALTAMVPAMLIALRLHIGVRQAVPLIVALGGLSAVWQSWRRRRKV